MASTSGPQVRRLDKGKGKLVEKEIFTVSNLFLAPTDATAKYHSRRNEVKTVAKWGQLKLAFNDILFLTYFWDPLAHPEIKEWIFLVAGAAPGHHFPVIAEMFPQFRFVLYDPSPFSISEELMQKFGSRITIHNALFTEEVAQEWSGRNNVFFSSDIRRGYSITKTASGAIENIIAEDMEMQKHWVDVINPVQAMLKFRLPYVDSTPGGDLIDKPVDYFDGFVAHQQWVGASSTETRLIPVKRNGVYLTKTWSSVKYQDQLFYHNTITREGIRYKSPFPWTSSPEYEYFDRYDETASVYILKAYIEKMSGNVANEAQSLALLDHIVASLNKSRKTPTSIQEAHEKTITSANKYKRQ